MARPLLKATPTVTGAVAKEIQRELQEGTPNTPKRVATINRAIEVFQRSTGQSLTPRPKNP
jgi:hypothetical protein